MFAVTIDQKQKRDIVNLLKKAINKRKLNLGGYVKAFSCDLDDSGYTKFSSRRRQGFVFAVNEGDSVYCEVWEFCRDADISKRYKEEAAVLEVYWLHRPAFP